MATTKDGWSDPGTHEGKWLVNIRGKAGSKPFEISIVRTGNKHGQQSYGRFDENKLLISHDGGPMSVALPEFIWRKMVRLAHEVANELNDSENKVYY